MHAAPNNALYNNQLSQAIQQVDADLSSGDEQLCDWTQALPDDEAADILVEYTPNNELNSLLGYIARYLNGEEQDISLRELTDRCITAQTTTEIQTQQDEQQKQNAWHKMVRHYHAAINDRDY
ncbi:hypothetical protein [Kingella oralis]|jgi:hypothetical protein|uniref:hypothetical protein n=1 Tax=Kingella oralis TaxID=505 RepID=UPI0020585C14|nr:MAG TPA: hypothetical protein [Caudoviricetes sp.]